MKFPRKLGALVARSITGTYDVTRTQPERNYDAGGALLPATEITLQVPANVQPASGGEVADLTPEGNTVYAAIDIFTTTRLYAGVTGVREADVITVDGFDFEVVSVEDFGSLAGFYRAQAVR